MQGVPTDIIGIITEYLTGTEWTMLSIAFRFFDNPYFSDKAHRVHHGHRVHLHEAFTSEEVLQWVLDRVPWLCIDMIVHSSMMSVTMGSVEMSYRRIPEDHTPEPIPSFDDLTRHKMMMGDIRSIKAMRAVHPDEICEMLIAAIQYGNLDVVRWIVGDMGARLPPEEHIYIWCGDILGTFLYLKDKGISCTGLGGAVLVSEALAREMISHGDSLAEEYDNVIGIWSTVVDKKVVTDANVLLKGLTVAKAIGYRPVADGLNGSRSGYDAAYMLGSIPLLQELLKIFPWDDIYMWSFALYHHEGPMRWVLSEFFGVKFSDGYTVTHTDMLDVLKAGLDQVVPDGWDYKIQMTGHVYDPVIGRLLDITGGKIEYCTPDMGNVNRDNYVSLGFVSDSLFISFFHRSSRQGIDSRYWRGLAFHILEDPKRSDELKSAITRGCRVSKNPYVRKLVSRIARARMVVK